MHEELVKVVKDTDNGKLLGKRKTKRMDSARLEY